MESHFAPTNLTDHFLIAMPGLTDALFARSVVYVCEHGPRGAMGLVINKLSDLNLQTLFEKVALPLTRSDLTQAPVYLGGPVNADRGFVLHQSLSAEEKPRYASTLSINNGLEMTTSKDVLEAVAQGAGPSRLFVSLGYSAWAEGQLESELGDNSWLTVPAESALIFDIPVEKRYQMALALLGVSEAFLSAKPGHA